MKRPLTLLLIWSLVSPSNGAETTGVVPLQRAPLLFADDSGVARRVSLTRTVQVARTRAEPVLVADQPWEHLRVYMWGTVHYDPAERRFAMWYMCRPPPPLGSTRTLYAVSEDGLRWTKPALGLVDFNGSKANNLLGPGGGSLAVMHDPIDPDPARRFKRITHRSGGYYTGSSPDGVRWVDEGGGKPALTAGDTVTLAQNPNTGEYLAYHKRPLHRGAFDVRAVWLARSRDFRTWSEPELVLAADAADQEWATQPDERTEIYDMAVYPHAAGYLGFPAVFRNKPQVVTPALKAAGGVAPDGPLDIQLATSVDGSKWRRSWPRVAVIPRGAPGTFDGGAILGVACAPVHTDDETWVYYSAIRATHGAPVPPKLMTIGRAEWRRHGFVSLDAGPQGGELETQPLQMGSPRLVVNADASRGEVHVSLVEVDGRPVAGRSVADSQPLTTDRTRWTVRWRDGDTVPTDRPVKVVLQMKNARLYSISIADPEPR
jgi:hypothetical protein